MDAETVVGVEGSTEQGEEEPPPVGPPTIVSGRLLLRLPRTLHAELITAARRDGVTVPEYVQGVLAAAVEWRGRAPEARSAPVDGADV